MCKFINITFCLMLVGLFLSCNKAVVKNQVTFGEDIEVLNKVISPIILKDGERQIAVSSEFQGRVFTSTSQGLNGMSYGWFNKNIFLSDSVNTNRSKLGGEGRIWFGPDLGKNAIFMTLDSITGEEIIRAPKDLDTLPFHILNQSKVAVTFGNKLHIENLKGFQFDIEVEREIEILLEEKVAKSFKIPNSENLSYVAYKTNTQMTNIGKKDWSKETGLMSLWDLGCYHPTPKTTVIIPLRKNTDRASVYFTDIDSSRIAIKENILYYKADANYLNKIGTQPEVTLPYYGSYSPEFNLLTIIKFSYNKEDIDYANSNPANKGNQYKGDVINVFNDGVWDDVGPFGPFYELESSSPVRELKIGESISHYQEVYHFQGSEMELNKISQEIFGVELETVNNVFN